MSIVNPETILVLNVRPFNSITLKIICKSQKSVRFEELVDINTCISKYIVHFEIQICGSVSVYSASIGLRDGLDSSCSIISPPIPFPCVFLCQKVELLFSITKKSTRVKFGEEENPLAYLFVK